jgi:hypothetical protein
MEVRVPVRYQEPNVTQDGPARRAPTEHLDIPSVVCQAVSVAWGSVELEPEVVEWLGSLPDDQFGRVEFYIDLLAERGAQLGEPYTRQLQGKLRELRFYLGPQSDAAARITYYIATGRRIILLTVFRKQRQRGRTEINRASRVMEKCTAEGHTVEDEHD